MGVLCVRDRYVGFSDGGEKGVYRSGESVWVSVSGNVAVLFAAGVNRGEEVRKLFSLLLVKRFEPYGGFWGVVYVYWCIVCLQAGFEDNGRELIPWIGLPWNLVQTGIDSLFLRLFVLCV